MAIVEMKKVTLLALTADRDRILRTMQRLGCVEVRVLGDADLQRYVQRTAEQTETATATLDRLAWAIKELGRYDTQKKGMLASFSPKPVAEEARVADVLAREAELLQVIADTEAYERHTGELRTREARLKTAIDQLTPWLTLDVPLERLDATRDTHATLGTVPTKHRAAMQAAIHQQGLPIALDTVSEDRSTTYFLALSHVSAKAAFEALLRENEGTLVAFSGFSGTVQARVAVLRAEIDAMTAEHEGIQSALAGLALYLGDLKLLHDLYDTRRMREQVAERFATTEQTFFLRAWVPTDRLPQVEKKLREVAPSCAIESADPADDEKPPTLLHNNRFMEPFEAVIENFSMPDPRGVDPTFIMAPFFACFFGMMVSDAGYGLIMAILIPLIIWLIKPKGGMRKMMWVIGIGGISTVIWGALFDTWFGASIHPLLLNPMTQPLEMMGLCLGIGAVHLFAGACIGAYKNFKRGDIMAALVDNICWMLLVLGVGMLMLPVTAAIGKILALVGVVGILFFTKRDTWNPLKRVLSGLGSLYGITSWLSDLLSYARLFGMGLATGVIGMVINMMAGMAFGSRFNLLRWVIGVLILIGGHLLNLAINALGAYVHACRLQYIEFFGKFYEDGGDPFRPLGSKTRYTQIQEQEQQG